MSCNVGSVVRACDVPIGARVQNQPNHYKRLAPNDPRTRGVSGGPCFLKLTGPGTNQVRSFPDGHKLTIVSLADTAPVYHHAAPAAAPPPNQVHYTHVPQPAKARCSENRMSRSSITKNPILLMMLLGGGNLFGGKPGETGGLQQMLPLLLLSDREGGSSITDDPLMLLLLMQGGTFGAAGSEGIGEILPLLLLSGEELDTGVLLDAFILKTIGASFTDNERQSWVEGNRGATVRSVLSRKLGVTAPAARASRIDA